MTYIDDNQGFAKPLIIIIVLVFCAYAGFQFAVPYYKHSVLKSDAKEMARVSLGREDKLRDMLYERINELKIPAKHDDIHVQALTNNSMSVRISWTDEVDILGMYHKQLFFNIDIRE